MKVLLLGSGGFLGRSVLERFRDLSQPNLGEFLIDAPRSSDLDLTNSEKVDEFFDKAYYDYVIFGAVKIDEVEKSIGMFLNVYRNYSKYGFLINIGSGAEYGPYRYQPKMKESHFDLAFPSEGYPLIKFVQGREIEFGKVNNAVNLRVFGIYGPYEDHSRRFISNNICNAINGKDMTCRQDMLFDYVYVDDFSDFLWNIINSRHQFKFRSYNFAPSSAVSLVEIGTRLTHRFPKVPFKVAQPGFGREYSGDPGRLVSEFGQVVKTPLDSGIEKMITYFTNQNAGSL